MCVYTKTLGHVVRLVAELSTLWHGKNISKKREEEEQNFFSGFRTSRVVPGEEKAPQARYRGKGREGGGKKKLN